MTHKLTPGQEEHFVKWAKIYADCVTYMQNRSYSSHINHIKTHARRQMDKAFKVYELDKFTDLGKVDISQS